MSRSESLGIGASRDRGVRHITCRPFHGLAARATEESLPGGPFGGDQEQVDVPEASERIEERELRLPLCLHPLRLGEQPLGLCPLPGLMERVGGGGAEPHLHKRIPAPVGQLDGAAGIGHPLVQPAQCHLQFAEVAGADRGILPVFGSHATIHPHPHQLDRFGEAAEGLQASRGLVEQPRLVRRT
jgi:hypothetical protein